MGQMIPTAHRFTGQTLWQVDNERRSVRCANVSHGGMSNRGELNNGHYDNDMVHMEIVRKGHL